MSVGLERGIAHPPRGDGGLEQLEEPVVDAPLHQDAAARAAVLTGVVEHRARRRRRGLLEVGVGEHDVRGLAAEFERDGLERAGAAGRDIRPHLGRAGEHDLAHVGMRDEALPDDRARPGDDLEQALGQPGLERELAEAHRRERGELGGLEHDRVAGGERRREAPRRDRHREVPRHDDADDAVRLVEGDIEAAGDRDLLSAQPLGGAGVEVEHLRDVRCLPPGRADRDGPS